MSLRPVLPFVFALGLGVAVACSALSVEKGAAESAYLAAQLDCVDENDTKASIDACRAAVRAQWALDAAADVRDAGGER